MTTDLREALHEELDHLVAPPGDLDRVHAAGSRLRRRRMTAAGALAVVAAGVLVVGLALHDSDGSNPQRGIDPIGQLDFSDGLRAYAAPGAEIHLGGGTFAAARLQFLDTDATATPYGVVFYDRGRPMLLEESGDISGLEPSAEKSRFHPTAKVDSQAPLVAYAVTRGGATEVVVRDLSTGDDVARHRIADGTVIDGIDGGVVFLRTSGVTTTWDSRSVQEQDLASGETRVADVRNGVLLYSGPAPTGPGAAAYRLVRGAIDAQLTYDGQHVLYWGSRLESTTGGKPIVLDQGPATMQDGVAWYAVDTDSSILAAVPRKGSTSEVYDCAVPSGTCADLGPLKSLSGDPEFIGVDM